MRLCCSTKACNSGAGIAAASSTSRRSTAGCSASKRSSGQNCSCGAISGPSIARQVCMATCAAAGCGAVIISLVLPACCSCAAAMPSAADLPRPRWALSTSGRWRCPFISCQIAATACCWQALAYGDSQVAMLLIWWENCGGKALRPDTDQDNSGCCGHSAVR